MQKREDTREFLKEKAAREEAAKIAAKVKPSAPYAAATSESQATARVVEAYDAWLAIGENLKALKDAARASEKWDQSVGYKAFREVMVEVAAYDAARIRYVETRLERALVLFYEAKGESETGYKTLDAFNWYYGRDFDANDGANAKSLTYMLPAVLKAQAPRAVAELFFVALNGGKNGMPCGVSYPEKPLQQAIGRLEDAAEYDLLEEDELAQLVAMKAFVAESDNN